MSHEENWRVIQRSFNPFGLIVDFMKAVTKLAGPTH